MKELMEIGENRLKQVLAIDKKENPLKVINVLKSELIYVLKNYMEIRADQVDFDIYVNNTGNYTVTLSANVKRIKVAKAII